LATLTIPRTELALFRSADSRCDGDVGNERDSANRCLLKDAGIDHVLNVTSHVPLHFCDDVTMTYCRVPASDSGRQNLKQFFSETVAFIG